MYQGINDSNGPKLSRSGSQICPTPEDELLEATLDNKVHKIEQLIRRHEYLLIYTYPDYNKKILLIACSEPDVNAATVEKLLNLKANPRDHNEDDGWEALHFAAQKTNFDVLNALLKRNPGDANNQTLQGGNALHILVRHGDRSAEDFYKCARLLIQKGVDVDQVDNNNKSALYWADKKGVGENIRRIIEEERANGLVINNNVDKDKDKSEYQQLLNLMKRGDEDQFLQINNDLVQSLANFTDCDCTLLQFACDRGLTRCVQRLLDLGADPSATGRINVTKPVGPPLTTVAALFQLDALLQIIIASEHGFSAIFQSLLDKYHPISNIPEGVLSNVLQYIDRTQHDNKGCYRAFINKMKQCPDPDEVSLKLNEVESNARNTPLHYAIRYADPEIVQDLLSLGASLGAKNKYKVMPIEDMEPQCLEKHLDNCIEFDIKSRKIEKEDFQVKFNYRSIIPPYAKCKYSEAYAYKDVEATGINSTIQKELVAETEVICYMSNTVEFQHLLKHPVIVSFLFMKWLQIQWLFWTNLAFYITFAVSLVVYIFSSYAYFPIEEQKSVILVLLQHVSYICLVLTLFVLLFRELFQMRAAPTNDCDDRVHSLAFT
ncbi:hypothetical protein HUJ05_000562 [Dendroctonus ponderosae]|nr:hypothetical protein HUJ05_000562 [Dendroctonus ponderosae]